jgi:hypothetical protein
MLQAIGHTPTGQGLANHDLIPEGAEISLFSTVSRPALRSTHPPILSNGGPILSGKVATAWSWCLSLSSVEVKNVWSYICTPPTYIFIAWCLIKHRDNFTFLQMLNVRLFNYILSYTTNILNFYTETY